MITRNDWIGLGVSIVIVAIMGFLALHGPFHDINKSAAPKATFPTIRLRILSDAKTVGKYAPATVTVHVGQTVIWTNASDADHTVTASNGTFDSGNIPIKGTWQYVPNKPGTYRYGCTYHPLMKGTLVVVPAA